mmetsp:Transcript_20214/g.48586  ORF Transcript_20214/g.48586 Transcript_20214/m.48586 type:complete len:129 (+) Transcript_20214:1693-2079(+)
MKTCLSAHNIQRPSNNVFGSHRSTFLNSPRRSNSTMSIREMTFPRRHLLQSEMMPDEDKEQLMFFENFAEALAPPTLPPPQENDDIKCCEPNPLSPGTMQTLSEEKRKEEMNYVFFSPPHVKDHYIFY